MSRTRLRLDLPVDSWIGSVSRSNPDATLRVTGTVAADEGDVTALSAMGTEGADVVETLRDHDGVDRIEVLDHRAAETVVRVTGPPPSYVAAARRVGVPVEPPVEVADGRATLVVVDDRERLSALGRRLAAAGVTVESAGGDESDPILTEAQRELVGAALEAGYYDTPRRCTLTELAAERDIAKSTCSETLHRAEGRLLRRFVEGEFGAGGDRAESGGTAAGDGSDPERGRERPEPTGAAASEP